MPPIAAMVDSTTRLSSAESANPCAFANSENRALARD
jgi:hypothetical protein